MIRSPLKQPDVPITWNGTNDLNAVVNHAAEDHVSPDHAAANNLFRALAEPHQRPVYLFAQQLFK
jgi:hypothetical protein